MSVSTGALASRSAPSPGYTPGAGGADSGPRRRPSGAPRPPKVMSEPQPLEPDRPAPEPHKVLGGEDAREEAVVTPAPRKGTRARGAAGGSAKPQDSAKPEDKVLIRRAQQGEEDAFAQLVERYQRRAWRVARNMVPSDEDAQDLAQEAFLRVFKSLEKFDFQHEFATWLYRIVTNLAIDHLRRRRPQFSLSGVDEDGEGETELEVVDPSNALPSDQLEAEETAGEVHDCLSVLAPHFQSVLVLRELEGLSCSEIADIVGATNVTVRWRLHRGRKLFQEEWERRARVSDRPLEATDDLLAEGEEPLGG